MFAVIVTFRIMPGAMENFLPAVVANARASLEIESECQRFDVCTDPEHPNEVFLYELYNDKAAFDAHLASKHYKAFDRRVADMIAVKDVRTYRGVVS